MRTTLLLAALIAAVAVAPAPSCTGQEKGEGQKHAKKHEKKPLPPPEKIAMLPPDGGDEFNRLIHEKSPYLLQHSRNPVDWYPWGKEAFALAKKLDRPIFLSVGYSTCHWCHVMAHESFENDEVAAILNADFVSIKVDREERPDVDEIYMNVTQLVTQRGGWPNSVWLMPDGRPFMAGTYFPPEDKFGRPGFKTILRHFAKAWKEQRREIESDAERIGQALEQMASGDNFAGSGEATRDLVRRAIDQAGRSFDRARGGFGGQPKFPPHGTLKLICYDYPRSKQDDVLAMATRTLDAMQLGGIHDHVGGGFARYSTDAEWFLPHFEKMLYDNAQLSRAYTDAFVITKNEAYRRTAVGIYEWVLREMLAKEGGFYSAYDADSEGEEGKFYLWKKTEVMTLLGDEDGALFCRIYGLTDEGNYHEEASGHRPGTNIAFLKKSLDQHAKDEKVDPAAFRKRMEAALATLYGVRKKRVWPHLDDKVLTSWNGLMIGSFAHAGKALGEPRYVEAAKTAAGFILENMRVDGRLRRTYRTGGAKLNGYLDDYSFLACGLLDLHEATGDKRWREEAEALMKTAIVHHWDAKDGGFFFTSDDHEKLLLRSKDPQDKAIPSGNGMAAIALVRLAKATGNAAYLDQADRTFQAFVGMMERYPRAAESLIYAVALQHDLFPDRAAKKKDEQKGGADAAVTKKPLGIQAFLSHAEAAPGTTIHVAVRLAVQPGWHVNAADPAQEHLTPTAIKLGENAAGATTGKVEFPAPSELKQAGQVAPLRVHDGEVWVKVPVVLGPTPKSRKVTLPFTVGFQACDDRRCLAPETAAFTLELEVFAGAKAALRHPKVFARWGLK